MVVLSLCVPLRRHCAAVIGEIYSLSDFRLRGHLPIFRFTSLALERPFPRGSVERSNSLYYQSISRRFCTETAKMSSNGLCPTKRSISFQDYDVLGFDLDHTIAKYKLVELFSVVYDCVTNFLVNERDYDPCIKDDLHKYKDFVCKGLFLDVAKGNIIKLGYDGTILRATHGTRLLSEADVAQAYGAGRKWSQVDTVRKTMRNSSCMITQNAHTSKGAFRFFENYFDCPGLVATARVIDLIDQKHESLSVEEKEALYTKAWMDTLDSLHNLYDPLNFSTEKGGYFQIVRKDTRKFVEECSEDIRCWLKALRKEGKMVFLLTSSQIDYASCLLEVCLGKDWQSYFDISLFHARKPGFFTDNNPFYALENDAEAGVVSVLKRNGCYSQGNIADFNKFLSKEVGKEDFKVLYFGDNICSDCYPSKHFANWGAVLLLEEMDAEGYVCSDGTVPGHEGDAANVVSGPNSKRRKVLEHSSLVTDAEIDYLLTDFWGPFLIHRDGKSSASVEMNTFWGDVIAQYSDIAVPSLEYLAGVPLDHRYNSFSGSRQDTSGFHPGPPSSLLP